MIQLRPSKIIRKHLRENDTDTLNTYMTYNYFGKIYIMLEHR